jgi:HptB-dependent secretion and biofilm anti anti-sigma factor
MLLLLREHAGGDRAKVKIVHCRPEVKKIFSIANFHQLFQLD